MKIHNSKQFNFSVTLLVFVSFVFFGFSNNLNAWRSSLYPSDWAPGDKDSQGLFLHDFSYAGYHRGEVPIPDTPSNNIVNVTASPYNADNSGSQNAKNAIQAAIDAVESAGGGVVYIPAGTYRITNPPLVVSSSNVVIRGAGQNQTKIFLDKQFMRGAAFFYLGKDVKGWKDPKPGTILSIDQDIPAESLTFRVSTWPSSFPYQVGDEILIDQRMTEAFVDDHGMRRYWLDIGKVTIESPSSSRVRRRPRYHRTITALNPSTREITVDIPIRYLMKTRDTLRVYKPNIPAVREIGIESLSIGMKQHSAYNGLIPSATNYKNANGTGREKAAYEIRGCRMIKMEGVVNGWIRDVSTYQPSGNLSSIHILSHGIVLEHTRNVTVKDTTIGRPQSRTGGGNGYMYRLAATQEALIQDATAINARHSFSILFFPSSGNVFHRFTSIRSIFPSDTHQYLSPAQLVDDSTFLGAAGERWGVSFANRGSTSRGAGHTSTQSVIWNAVGKSEYLITNVPQYISRPYNSEQYATGYIIGTSGDFASSFRTCPMTPDDPGINNPV